MSILADFLILLLLPQKSPRCPQALTVKTYRWTAQAMELKDKLKIKRKKVGLPHCDAHCACILGPSRPNIDDGPLAGGGFMVGRRSSARALATGGLVTRIDAHTPIIGEDLACQLAYLRQRSVQVSTLTSV
ncbi:hypothetical protein DFH09DRAFT_1324679 [Mycena vulgaris]|nr:hypothetical protein DFH09DRAFT_1324679 [Mycena vulgaris]